MVKTEYLWRIFKHNQYKVHISEYNFVRGRLLDVFILLYAIQFNLVVALGDGYQEKGFLRSIYRILDF